MATKTTGVINSPTQAQLEAMSGKRVRIVRADHSIIEGDLTCDDDGTVNLELGSGYAEITPENINLIWEVTA